MQFLDLTLPTLADNLALDEALLLEAEAGQSGEVLRIWEWPGPAVILGAGCRLAEDVDAQACQADSVPIARRTSGGGTILLGSGCLVYSLVLCYERAPALREISSSYGYILERVRTALAGLLPDVERSGISDLAAGGRKFSGNSQQRKHAHLLHHGTLLYHFDLASIGRYLRMPSRQPEYRHHREHADFLMNLPSDADDLKVQLRKVWQAEQTVGSWPEARTRQLAQDRYSRPEWNRRR